MAVTTTHTTNQLTKFSKVVTKAYVRNERFHQYMGPETSSIIRRISDLESKGREIRIPLVGELTGAGTSTGTLAGNEEALDNYGAAFWADYFRHAVKFREDEVKDSSFDMETAASECIQMRVQEVIKNELVSALLTIPTGAPPAGFRVGVGNRVMGITYQAASAAQRNAWVDGNNDRILFGSANSNYVAGNAALSLANIDTVSDKLNTSLVSLAKRKAKATTANKIKPYKVEDLRGAEQYVMFVGTLGMRDLRLDNAMQQADRDARPREEMYMKNPIFSAGDAMWDNIVVTEIPEIDQFLTLAGAGAAASNVVPAFLCGTNALAFVIGQAPEPTRLVETDYQFNTGVGIKAQHGIGKIYKAAPGTSILKDFGMVTVFHSATADA